MSEIRDKVRKELMDYLEDWLFQGDDMSVVEDIVDDILNSKVFPEIAVVDRRAELPYSHSVFYAFYRKLLSEENWVKEVDKDCGEAIINPVGYVDSL